MLNLSPENAAKIAKNVYFIENKDLNRALNMSDNLGKQTRTAITKTDKDSHKTRKPRGEQTRTAIKLGNQEGR